MNQRPVLHALLLALSAWMLLQLTMRFLGMHVSVLVVALAGTTAATVYLLRFQPQRLSRLCQHWIGRKWVQTVSAVANLQVAPSENSLAGLNVRTAEDFSWLHQRLQEEMFGQAALLTTGAEELRAGP